MVWISSRWKVALMLAPALILFTAFFVYPVGSAIAYSLTNSAGFGAAKFVGFKNYAALLDDPFFWQSFKNTVVILWSASLPSSPRPSRWLCFSSGARGQGHCELSCSGRRSSHRSWSGLSGSSSSTPEWAC